MRVRQGIEFDLDKRNLLDSQKIFTWWKAEFDERIITIIVLWKPQNASQTEGPKTGSHLKTSDI